MITILTIEASLLPPKHVLGEKMLNLKLSALCTSKRGNKVTIALDSNVEDEICGSIAQIFNPVNVVIEKTKTLPHNLRLLVERRSKIGYTEKQKRGNENEF